jgi:hypothetical protein
VVARFEESYYKKIEDVRMYKKYVLENNVIMMEFDRDGILQFINGKKENRYINQLIKIW